MSRCPGIGPWAGRSSRRLAMSVALAAMMLAPASAATLPADFTDEVVLEGLHSPASLVFSPDGRMFVGERIFGRLRIAHRTPGTDDWVLAATPFHTFDIPTDSGGFPSPHRSSGLRDFAFDPNFPDDPYLYVFYMKDEPRQNRLVRLRASDANPDLSMPASETLLLEMPFQLGESTGSHNGGAVEVGPDGMVYVTTGDGYIGADPVQSLDTYTGKVFRIGRDGVIPASNAFYGNTTGDLRAIVALGLRNPYSMSKHPVTGALSINDASGPSKADIYALELGANYGHQGAAPDIGVERSPWANAASAGGFLVTGGAWYPSFGSFPAQFRDSYFAALWGSNNDEPGDIARIADGAVPTVSLFAADVAASDGGSGNVKPVVTRVGPDGHLYYLLTDYITGDGAVHRIRYDGSLFYDGFESGDMAGWVPAP